MSAAEALRKGAKGLYASEAAVELLIRSGSGVPEKATWITWRDDETAYIDAEALWNASGAWSGGEKRLVNIVVALLGFEKSDLSSDVSGLDYQTLKLVLAAISHAAGGNDFSDLERDEAAGTARFVRLPNPYPWPESSK